MVVMDEDYKRAEWDSREKYAVQLHDYNTYANLLKEQIELRKGNTLDNLNKYYSVLRTLYRDLKHFIKPGEKIKIKKSKKVEVNRATRLWFENQFTVVKSLLGSMKIRNRPGFIEKTGSMVVIGNVEERMEDIHNELNDLRFKHGLVVPTSEKPKKLEDLL